jgi:hypothetical protein
MISIRQARRIATIAFLAGASSLLSACGISAPPSAHQALARAIDLLDSARSFYVRYQTSGKPPQNAIDAIGGQGALVRPDNFSGSFEISDDGLPLAVPVVVWHGRTYIELPLSRHFTQASPTRYGFPSPLQILDPRSGLPAVFIHTRHLGYLGQTRMGGIVTWKLDGTVPDLAVAQVLGTIRVRRDIPVTFYVDPNTKHLLEVQLVGPFLTHKHLSTVSIIFSDYNSPFRIERPS